MKRHPIIICFLFIANALLAQDVIKYNVVYEFRYVRDLENKDVPYSSMMVLSLGKSSSRYCTQKMFNDNDRKILEARKKEMERLQTIPAASMPTVAGGPMLTVGKSGALIIEEIVKNISEKRISIDTKLGLKSYHAETELPEIKWTVLTETKKIGSYVCQKATGSYGGRQYNAWFTKDILFQDGPWKLHGLPGLILEANDTANEISFTFKEISENNDVENTVQSFMNSQYSVSVKTEDLNKAKKAFEIDPEGVMGAQAPNARLYVRNIDNPTEKTVLKIKAYNPMELK